MFPEEQNKEACKELNAPKAEALMNVKIGTVCSQCHMQLCVCGVKQEYYTCPDCGAINTKNCCVSLAQSKLNIEKYLDVLLDDKKTEATHCTCDMPQITHNNTRRIMGSICVKCNKKITFGTFKPVEQPSEKKESEVSELDKKTLKVLWATLNVCRNYFPEGHKINQMLIDPLNELQRAWESKKEGKDG